MAPRNSNMYARNQTAPSCSVRRCWLSDTVRRLCVCLRAVRICDHTCWGSPVCLLPVINPSAPFRVPSFSTTPPVTQPHGRGIMGNSPDSQLECTSEYNVSEESVTSLENSSALPCGAQQRLHQPLSV